MMVKEHFVDTTVGGTPSAGRFRWPIQQYRSRRYPASWTIIPCLVPDPLSTGPVNDWQPLDRFFAGRCVVHPGQRTGSRLQRLSHLVFLTRRSTRAPRPTAATPHPVSAREPFTNPHA